MAERAFADACGAEHGAGYLPISSYGVIGNLRTVALVGLNGSIDWCCFPQLDSPSVFAGLLDSSRGGSFSIRPAGRWSSHQHYLHRTNVLETVFDVDGARLILTDWMPLSGDLEGSGRCGTAPRIHRRLRAEGGPLEVVLCWDPRLDYGRGRTRIVETRAGFVATRREHCLLLQGTLARAAIEECEGEPRVAARFTLEPDRPHLVTTHYGDDAGELDPEEALRTLEETARLWRGWLDDPRAEEVRRSAVGGPDQIARSELALKLLTHGETGAVAAAATTSLPEVIGGERNWDYRYAWIRDASQTIESFLAYRHRQEALDFLAFLERCIRPRLERGQGVGIVYGIDGRHKLPERELRHLEGYRRSRPVRIGNHAYRQTQHDSYGEILHSAYELARRGEVFGEPMRRFLAQVADRAAASWRKPDHGMWEMPGPLEHHVYTKVLCWVALDRAIRLGSQLHGHGDVECWRRERDRIHEEVLRRGYDEGVGAFVQSYGSQRLDASNLLLPMHEFIPYEDPRVRATIDRTIERLVENKLVYRYRLDDGLPGEEGAFGICGFWLADALAFSGRLDEAHEYFEAMASRANHLGLFSEEIDPRTGASLGNFPQGLTHIGFLDSAFHLAYACGRRLSGSAPPVGSAAHRRLSAAKSGSASARDSKLT